MNDISDILRALLDKYSNTSQLDEQFHRMLDEDPVLHDEYNQWCDDQGLGRATGYREFINEIAEDQDTIWEQYQEFGN
ncbi:MAG: hypothetical protein IJT30_05675 [Muribaculaceae bacterium]|nr:hypothetical protein [Muribaculaceae bacterium]